jgi:hypothetical protein
LAGRFLSAEHRFASQIIHVDVCAPHPYGAQAMRFALVSRSPLLPSFREDEQAAQNSKAAGALRRCKLRE